MPNPESHVLNLALGDRAGRIPQRKGVRGTTPEGGTHRWAEINEPANSGTAFRIERLLPGPMPWRSGGAAVVAPDRGKSPTTVNVT